MGPQVLGGVWCSLFVWNLASTLCKIEILTGTWQGEAPLPLHNPKPRSGTPGFRWGLVQLIRVEPGLHPLQNRNLSWDMAGWGTIASTKSKTKNWDPIGPVWCSLLVWNLASTLYKIEILTGTWQGEAPLPLHNPKPRSGTPGFRWGLVQLIRVEPGLHPLQKRNLSWDMAGWSTIAFTQSKTKKWDPRF